MEVTAALSASPIEKVQVAGHHIYIKRDDLLNPHFSGNKARKFAYYIENNTKAITRLVSYGSIQANSLYSLAALAHIKGWQLDYYVSRTPAWLKGSTLGNYGQAIALGANIIEVEKEQLDTNKNLDNYMRKYAETLPDNTLFIPEGGRSCDACVGISVLAKEITEYCNQHNVFNQNKNVQLMLPSGTGTTALFLQTWFKENNINIQVLTCACVGNSDYLKQQFNELNTNVEHWPTILPSNSAFHFGKLNKAHYLLWKQLQQETGIEFELLYDPIGWQCLLEHLSKQDHSSTFTLYLHQGGLVGNQTMLPRYQRKYSELF